LQPFTIDTDLTKKSTFFHFFVYFLFTFVWNSVKILVCLPEGKRKPPADAGFCGEPQVVSCSAARS
jgi:hypothetical protein